MTLNTSYLGKICRDPQFHHFNLRHLLGNPIILHSVLMLAGMHVSASEG